MIVRESFLNAGMQLLVLIFTGLMSANAFAGLENVNAEYVAGEVLVVPRSAPSLESMTALGLSLAQNHSGKSRFMRLKLKSGQRMSVVLSALSAQSWVAAVQPNYIYKISAVPNDPRFPEYWGLDNTGQIVNGVAGTAGVDISAVAAWDEVTDCSSVIAAVIDSGVDYNHPDLVANIWSNTAEIIDGIDNDGNGFVDDVRGWDFVQKDNDPMDFNGHGSHITGTLGASGNNGIGGTGICWNIQVMPVRALGSTGQGTTSDIVLALDYAVANGARVINMSFGGPGGATGDLMDTAIANAGSQGVLLVAAAGNSSSNNDALPMYPASYLQSNIISVAATGQSDQLETFSNFGLNSVDVGAPGLNILSSKPPARIPACGWNFDTGTIEGWMPETLDVFTGLPVPNTVAVSGETFISPGFSLTDTPGAFYANNRSYRAVSPRCNLATLQGVMLSYRLNLDTEAGVDMLLLESSVGGTVWNVVDGWTGRTGGWDPQPFDADLQALDGVATAQVRFRLETDFSIALDGFHVDDVSFTVPGTVYGLNPYTFLSGTSMATAHVSGLASLILAADPGLTVSQLHHRILNNGDALSSLAGRTVSGRRVNARMSMPLHAPEILNVTASAPTTVVLLWLDHSVSETDQIIQRDAGAGFTDLVVLPADVTAFTDVLAPSGTILSYRVVARARDGRSFASTAVSVTTPPPPSSAGGGSGGGCLIPDSTQRVWTLGLLIILLIAIAKVRVWKRIYHR